MWLKIKLHSNKFFKKKRAFTLIELLIVIAILAILAAAVMGVILISSQAKARDGIRKANLRQIADAVRDYYFDHGFTYPAGGPYFSNGSEENWIPGLVPDYLKTFPKDPKQAGIISQIILAFKNFKSTGSDNNQAKNDYVNQQVAGVNDMTAVFNSSLGVPACTTADGSSCDTGVLPNSIVKGKAGSETNTSNTLTVSSCFDRSGSPAESIERIRVYTVDGTAFRPGKSVLIDATFIKEENADENWVEFYYSTTSSGIISWTMIGSAQIVDPEPGGQFTYTSSAFNLGANEGMHTVRVNYRNWGNAGNAAPCTGDINHGDERDDVVFNVSEAPDTISNFRSFTVTNHTHSFGKPYNQ